MRVGTMASPTLERRSEQEGRVVGQPSWRRAFWVEENSKCKGPEAGVGQPLQIRHCSYKQGS